MLEVDKYNGHLLQVVTRKPDLHSWGNAPYGWGTSHEDVCNPGIHIDNQIEDPQPRIESKNPFEEV